MVLYSKDLKYIYIHISKTGGSTIKKTLPFTPINYKYKFKYNKYDKYMYIENNYHLKSTDIEKLNIDNIEEYFTFTFVRNPYDRLYSTYLYIKNMKTQNFNNLTSLILLLVLFISGIVFSYSIKLFLIYLILFRKFFRFIFNLYFTDFNYFIKTHFEELYKILPYSVCPQYDYISNSKIDFIGREESFDDDLKFLINKFNLNVVIKNDKVNNKW